MTSVATKCALFALLLVVCGSGVAAAVPNPAAFEDRNDNGVFDAGDVDIADLLRLRWVFNTPHSVVIQGTIKVYDPETWRCRGLFITAGKNITVNGSIINPGYAGSLALTAGETLTIGDKVTFNARTHVALSADSIAIGDNVRMYAKGEGAFFYGAITAMSAGDITVGRKFVAQSFDSFKFTALAGEIALGPAAQITTDRLFLTAKRSVTADGARLKGDGLNSALSTGGSGPISLRSSVLSVGQDGSITIIAANGSVDLTGARFNVPPDVTARTLIEGK